jgi:enoyl-CoA hydratase/carnithine racemase
VSYRRLEVERDGPVLRVWLNRPEKLNAIDAVMLDEVAQVFGAVSTDFETRVVVLAGRGRSFCAGADRRPGGVTARPDHEPGARERRWNAQIGRRACRAIEECEALTVARIHGHALGGGACFALACDFRIAARDAQLRYPEVDLGVPLSWAGVPRLVQEIGAARARELLVMCSEVDGAKAESWGMVHRAVAPGALDGEVAAWVDALLAKPEGAVHQTKTQLRAYARLATLGDVTEGDGDMIDVALRDPAMRARFRMGEDGGTS